MKNLIKTFLLTELWKGLGVTFGKLYGKKITVQYPEEKTPQSPRFRGLHALRRYPNGQERCYQSADRQVIPEARTQSSEVDVEHHDDEQKQHHDGADVNEHERDREELGFNEQPQECALHEREHEE